VSGRTSEAGVSGLVLRAATTDPLLLQAQKSVYAETTLHLPVSVAAETSAPELSMILPEFTNQPSLTFKGLTQPGVTLKVMDQVTAVASNGTFTATVALTEGANVITASAVDNRNQVMRAQAGRRQPRPCQGFVYRAK
jgi:hypothetical protein